MVRLMMTKSMGICKKRRYNKDIIYNIFYDLLAPKETLGELSRVYCKKFYETFSFSLKQIHDTKNRSMFNVQWMDCGLYYCSNTAYME